MMSLRSLRLLVDMPMHVLFTPVYCIRFCTNFSHNMTVCYRNIRLLVLFLFNANSSSLELNALQCMCDHLKDRLQQNETRVNELINQIDKLEQELANLKKFNHYQNDTKDIASQEKQEVGRGDHFLLPPPPPPVLTDNFKFSSTPNPVFLSRGKLHEKSSSFLKSLEVVPASEKDELSDSYMKKKKQRVTDEDLVNQKQLLRKINVPKSKMNKNIFVDHSSEKEHSTSSDENSEIEDSLGEIVKQALKRKFANVNDISSIDNESLFSEENSGFSNYT